MTLSSYEGARTARWREQTRVRPLAQGLGWFSIGLGLAELTAPRTMARMLGVADDRDNRMVLQGAGLRELATGIGILSTPRPQSLLWSRVAGDVMDLLLLAGASSREHNDRARLSVAAAAVLGVTALDVYGALAQDEETTPSLRGMVEHALPASVAHGVRVKTAVTIHRPRADVYAFWRQLDNLPRFMSHLESVTVVDNVRSRWRAKAPFGFSVEWDADIVSDVPNEQLGWKSTEGAEIPNAGSVRFRDADGGRGTEVLVELAYRPPGAGLAATFAKLFGEEPSQQVREDLRRFKQVMETGAVTSTASGGSGATLAPSGARPARVP